MSQLAYLEIVHEKPATTIQIYAKALGSLGLRVTRTRGWVCYPKLYPTWQINESKIQLVLDIKFSLNQLAQIHNNSLSTKEICIQRYHQLIIHGRTSSPDICLTLNTTHFFSPATSPIFPLSKNNFQIMWSCFLLCFLQLLASRNLHQCILV